MKRRNCVGSPPPAAYYKDLSPKCQIVPPNIPVKKTDGAVKLRRFRFLRSIREGTYFLPSAIAACAAARRAIGTRNGLQET